MIGRQRSPLEFGPTVTASPVTVTDVPGVSSTISNSGVSYVRQTSASFHFDYQLSGLGVGNATVVEAVPPVDASSYPLVKRTTPGFAAIRLSNGRGTTDPTQLDFANRGGQTSYSNPKSVQAGSYAEYSWNRVAALFGSLDNGTPENHRVLDASHQRRLPGTIPHSSLLCHQDNINEVGGHLRGVAVTRRHVIGIAHSGNSTATGYTVRFRDINGVAVDRTVIKNVPVAYDPAFASFGGPRDVRLLVLNADLPESITPALYVGDWFFNYTGTATEGTYNPGAFGFVAFNQDTHLSPVEAVNSVAYPFTANYSATINGTLISGREFGLMAYRPITLEGQERWSWTKSGGTLGNWYPDRPFFHVVRAGDSGSPIFWPVADGKWAIGFGIISGSMWRPAAINALIAQVNAEISLAGSYTVTVAPNPLA